MSVAEIKELLEHIEDTHELVLRPADGDEHVSVWRAARSEANAALRAWRVWPGADAYAVYRAAEDRADAAEASLAACARD
ncbi:MAG: hypothetical protein M3Z33_07640 [Actinomycetota bacterium]|nr:hypothetical protein [Actinomycetota bacterium]